MKSFSKVFLTALLLSAASYSFASNTAKATTRAANVQDRHLSGFNAVDVSGSYDVYIVQGTTESVKVEAPADVMPHIVTEVEGGTLKIHDRNNSGWNWHNWLGGMHKKIAVYVSARDLNSIGITGSGDVEFKGGIHTSSLKLWVTGSGDMSGRVDVQTLECRISGSGDMKLVGHAENSSLSLSGSGDFSGKGLSTSNTTVHVSGSGDAAINASSSITASVSGSGDISYTGGARSVIKLKSGSGDISRD